MSKYSLLLVAVIAFLIPLVLAIILKAKTRVKIFPFIVGAIIFLVFADIIESLIHTYLLVFNEKTSSFLYSSWLTYTLYGGLMAGIFEETGRLVGFKVLLKNYKDKATSIAYGIGHGGIECIILLGSTYFLYFLVMSGVSIGSAETNALMLQTINGIDPKIVPIAVLERCIAIALHIGLSILVFKAANEKGNFKLFFIAILLHALADVPAGMYQFGLITSIALIEVLTFIISATVLFVAIKMYKKMEG